MYKVSEIIKEVKRLKKEYPDCVYHGNGDCSYSRGSCKNGPKTKGCLLGQAIRNIYPDLFKQIKNEVDNEGIEEVFSQFEIKHTEKQLEVLNEIQYNQDIETPWGEA